MEKNSKEVVYTSVFFNDLQGLYEFGHDIFGETFANIFQQKVMSLTVDLSTKCLMYPECRHLETPEQTYRNIIFDNFLIIYRVTSYRVEILRIIRGSLSTKKIKSIKNL